MKLLLVEDDLKATTFLKKGLSESGFVVDAAANGDDGLALARAGGYAVIVLDVMLPGLDGWDVLTELRKGGDTTPVLFVTGRDAIPDRVKGLELGADDYILKPVSFVELLARVRTVLRRGPARVAGVRGRGRLVGVDRLEHKVRGTRPTSRRPSAAKPTIRWSSGLSLDRHHEPGGSQLARAAWTSI